MPVMETDVIVLHGRTRRKLLRLSDGWKIGRIAKALSCSPAPVRKVRDRWLAERFAGLVDRREDNGQTKADERYVATVRWILDLRPTDFGHRRPTWTKALLIDGDGQRHDHGSGAQDVACPARACQAAGAVPWSEKRRKIRMAAIHGLIDSLPPYDPDDNRIERKLWREVHANVTTNHNFAWIESLSDEVVGFMTRHNIRAALRERRELRTAI
jgi:hypothetical protein